jgi:hypothetical protein
LDALERGWWVPVRRTQSSCYQLYPSQTKILEGGTKDEIRTFTPPKRRFWKEEPAFQNAFSKHFSRVWVLDLGDKTLKSASKTHSEKSIRPSKIFVWGE